MSRPSLVALLVAVSVLVIVLLAKLADGKALPHSTSSMKTSSQSEEIKPVAVLAFSSSSTNPLMARTDGSEESSEEEGEEEGDGEEEEGKKEKEEEEEEEEEEIKDNKKEEEEKSEAEKEEESEKSPGESLTEEATQTNENEEMNLGEDSQQTESAKEKEQESAQLPPSAETSPEVLKPHQDKHEPVYTTTRRPFPVAVARHHWAQPKTIKEDEIEAELWAKSPTSFQNTVKFNGNNSAKSVPQTQVRPITPAGTFKLNSFPYFHAFRSRI